MFLKNALHDTRRIANSHDILYPEEQWDTNPLHNFEYLAHNKRMEIILSLNDLEFSFLAHKGRVVDQESIMMWKPS